MARSWTQKQESAIKTRDRTLLISAAAGSGKTATLTERVISSVLDENDPISVNELLVVTFTNAAALELRERITARVAAALAADPTNAHLARQLELLPLANIRTIDSFCNEILKQNTASVRLPPNYRIAEEAEISLLSTRVMEELVEGVLRGEYPEIADAQQLLSLIDATVGVKEEEKIIPAFLYVYNKTKTHEDALASLLPLVEDYNLSGGRDISDTVGVKYILGELRSYTRTSAEVLARYLRVLSDAGDEVSLAFVGYFRPTLDGLRALCEVRDYAQARERLFDLYLHNMSATKKKGRSADVDEAVAFYREIAAEMKDMRDKFFLYTPDQYRELCAGLYEKCSVLYRFLCRFDFLFGEQKRAMALCEHSDIERYAYECLYDSESGTPSEYAISVRQSFRAVYIDEYQDVNRLQNKIFEAVSTPQNRFMVGDIKQSIYSFRSADPGIFAQMKKAFAELDGEHGGTPPPPASIFMSDNFRSDRGVVSFVNDVFDCVFGLVGDSIGYVESDKLVCAKYRGQDAESEYRPAELLLVEPPPRRARTLSPESEEEEGVSRTEAEARAVAARIREMLAAGEKKNDGTPIQPRDIAIMLRSTKTKAKVYADALMAQGIDAAITASEDFFVSPEVLIALCLLNTVDNPLRDVYLTGLLLSPLYGFTPDELTAVRNASSERTCPMISALEEYVGKNPAFVRGKKFLSDLSRYRAEAEGVGVDVLLGKLYYETGLLTLASTHGGLDNLMLLYDFASRFERCGFRGLYAFIRYVNDIIENNERFDNKPDIPKDENVVRIITIHASKGLEFPVCFLSGAGSPITDGDVQASKGTLEFSEGFGLAMKLRDPTGLVVMENPAVNILKRRRMELIFEEEMRILYVALTRARERIIVSGTTKGTDGIGAYLERMSTLRQRLTPELMKMQRSYLSVILLSPTDAVLRRFEADASPLESGTESEESRAVSREAKMEKGEFDFVDPDGAQQLRRELSERLRFRYPLSHLSALPKKLSVSYLTPTVLDGNEDEELRLTVDEKSDTNTDGADAESYDENGDLVDKESIFVDILPEFYDGEPLDAPARRGTATHMMMQFADMERLYRTSAREELDILVKDGFLSARDAGFVRLDEVERFRKSRLLQRILGAKHVIREFRFHVTLPARLFTEDAQKAQLLADTEILVQGVMDCLIEEEDGTLVLVDYKTDRLPREAFRDRTLARRILEKKHSRQLSYYAMATEKIFGRTPTAIEIYSLPLGDTVDVQIDGTP